MHAARVLASAALVASTVVLAPASAQSTGAPPIEHSPPSTSTSAAAPEHSAGTVTLDIDFEYQETGYWCGPAATRIALSAQGIDVTQQQMADELPTTTNGTDSITQVTDVLNAHIGGYETRQMPNDPPTQDQKDLLWSDIVADIDNGKAIVANIVAPPGNHPPGYPDTTIYHYFTVIGYNADTGEVLIADPAGFADTETYWLTLDKLASLIPPKGYSA